jgi:hypothetical protein
MNIDSAWNEFVKYSLKILHCRHACNDWLTSNTYSLHSADQTREWSTSVQNFVCLSQLIHWLSSWNQKLKKMFASLLRILQNVTLREIPNFSEIPLHTHCSGNPIKLSFLLRKSARPPCFLWMYEIINCDAGAVCNGTTFTPSFLKMRQ